jgi:chromosome segregation ATPase
MTGIVERLRAHPGEGLTVTEQFRNMVEQRHEAADEIDRLREGWREASDLAVSGVEHVKRYSKEIDQLIIDNERLREQVEALRLVATSHEPEALRLQAEVEHLRTTLGYLADNISDYPALVAVAEAALKPKP